MAIFYTQYKFCIPCCSNQVKLPATAEYWDPVLPSPSSLYTLFFCSVNFFLSFISQTRCGMSGGHVNPILPSTPHTFTVKPFCLFPFFFLSLGEIPKLSSFFFFFSFVYVFLFFCFSFFKENTQIILTLILVFFSPIFIFYFLCIFF